ncbi:hypothetical protein WISP_08865 [Willisornis vidua]|uniref:Endonuclease/exonuclease/phosphatase domain-containing protein n=1 Tax=Willisornis vidua TaxID=1566151 RepID=A0ABQ9DSP8_9PASS|nr:hypothetical protein WISP_08865 [Willisornis vidua]
MITKVTETLPPADMVNGSGQPIFPNPPRQGPDTFKTGLHHNGLETLPVRKFPEQGNIFGQSFEEILTQSQFCERSGDWYPLGHSDHKVIEVKIPVDKSKCASKTSTLDLRRADFSLLRELVREKIHAAKTQLELNLARNVGDIKYIDSNRQYRNIIGPLQDEDGQFTNMDRDKAEVFNAFFASVFNTDDGPRGSRCPALEDYDCKNYQLSINPETLWDLQLQLDP